MTNEQRQIERELMEQSRRMASGQHPEHVRTAVNPERENEHIMRR